MATQFEQDKQSVQDAQQRNESLRVFHSWALKHPELPRNDQGVVVEAVVKLFEEYADFTDPLSEEDFEFAFGNLKSRISLRRVPTVQEINQERREMSTTELHEIVKQENPPPRPDDLPLEITLPGRKTPTSIATRADLIELAKSHYGTFRELVDRYGSEKINKRMGVKPTPQPGYAASLKI